MSDNPLDDSNEARLQRIRERAYHLWQADGCPHGRDLEYWERARELVGIEESSGAGQLPNPAEDGDPTRVLEQPIEEAAIQENLGEFPGRLTDQGERAQTPAPRKRRGKGGPARGGA